MEWLAWLFVGKPLHIAAVAAAAFVGFLAVRRSASGDARGSRSLLIAATGWLSYAAWEWLVQVRTPEANIRVDLLVIWPVLALLSAWALVRALRPALRDATTRRRAPGVGRPSDDERPVP